MANPRDPLQHPTAHGDASTTDEVVHKAKDQARELGQQAKETLDHAKDSVRATATKQKDAAAERMDGVAHALMSASDDLRAGGQEFAAGYVKQAAGGLERVSDAVRDRDIDDLIGTVEDFARRQPVAFLGGAVVAGFGLARLMKSSADRRRSAATKEVSHDAHG
jgi:hypothetical protein